MPVSNLGSGNSLASKFSRGSKVSRGSKTSKTMTVHYLKWSLGWTVQLGIFHRRIFQNEMMRASKRKSTLEPSQKMLIQRNSAEYEKMQENELRRSKTVDINTANYSINDESLS